MSFGIGFVFICQIPDHENAYHTYPAGRKYGRHRFFIVALFLGEYDHPERSRDTQGITSTLFDRRLYGHPKRKEYLKD